jgi:thioredoxin 1
LSLYKEGNCTLLCREHAAQKIGKKIVLHTRTIYKQKKKNCMKRSFIITLCLLMAGFAMQVNGQTNVTIVTDANFEKEVLFSKDMVLVYFYASWSGPCRIANPVITKFANDYKGKVKVCKIDADDNPTVNTKYNTKSLPTVLIFKDGTLIDKETQIIKAERLKKMCRL